MAFGLLPEVSRVLDRALPVQRMLAERNGKGGRQSRYCLAVETAQKQSIWHYQPLKSCTFLRIVVATPNLVTQARSEQLAARATLQRILA